MISKECSAETATCSKKAVLKFAGAFIAWVIGSGFATGQEVLQFFTSYGYMSYGVLLINLIGFMLVGYFLLITGFEHKDEKLFRHFDFFCGKKIGTFYSWMTTIVLIFIMPVLISGAGATLHEYYGVDTHIGSAIMAVMVLAAYLIGFERLMKVVSSIGPVIIVFSLAVGIITIFKDLDNFANIESYGKVLEKSQTAPHWAISGVLYLSLTFFPGSAYFTQIGKSASSKKEAKYGAVFGAASIVLALIIMSTAILLNGGNVAALDVPLLYLTRKISYTLGAVFSIVLILGMFSSCSAMMWTVCSRFRFGGKKGNTAFAVAICALAFVLGLFSFSNLIGTLYPIVGYIGLFFIGCVIYKGVAHVRRT